MAEKKVIRVSVRISKSLLAVISRAAELERRTESDMIRELIRRGILSSDKKQRATV